MSCTCKGCEVAKAWRSARVSRESAELHLKALKAANEENRILRNMLADSDPLEGEDHEMCRAVIDAQAEEIRELKEAG